MRGSGSTFATAQNLEQFLLWIRKTEILKQLSSESSPLCLLLILPPITPPSTGYGLPSPSSYVLSYAPTLAEPEGVCGAVPYGLCYTWPLLDSSSMTYELMEQPSTIMTRNEYSLSVGTFRCKPATTFLTTSAVHQTICF